MTATSSRGVDVLTFGEAMVSFRSPDRSPWAAPLTTHVAGAESNVAIGLARLGHASAWVGRVGADRSANSSCASCAPRGWTSRHAVRDPGRQTGLMFLEQRTADVTRVDYRRAGSAGSAALPPTTSSGPGGRRPRPAPDRHHRRPRPEARGRGAVGGRACRRRGHVGLPRRQLPGRLWSARRPREPRCRARPARQLVIASDDELDLVTCGDGEDAASGEALLCAGASSRSWSSAAPPAPSALDRRRQRSTSRRAR